MVQSKDMAGVEAALAKAELFASISEAGRTRLAKAGAPCALDPGALLFARGDKGDALYVLLEGEVEIRTSNEAGRDVRLAALKPYAVIGEMAVLDGGARSADVAAIRHAISAVTDNHAPSNADVARVRAHLAAGGWPLATQTRD